MREAAVPSHGFFGSVSAGAGQLEGLDLDCDARSTATTALCFVRLQAQLTADFIRVFANPRGDSSTDPA